MDGAGLDREACLRREIQTVLADLREYGIPEPLLQGKCLAELWELRDAALRHLMGAPGAAA